VIVLRHGSTSPGEMAGFIAVCALLIAIIVGSFGCVPQIAGPYKDQPRLPKKPGQETAEAIIQRELALLTGWSPPASGWRWPEVEWVEGAALTCYGDGWFEYWARNKDHGCDIGTAVDAAPPQGPGLTSGPACKVCLLGLSLIDENIIESNWRDARPIHESSLTHEYCHYFELWATGDDDGGHVGPCYTGQRWVDVVNRTLESAGL
jgi:hypothetical protein